MRIAIPFHAIYPNEKPLELKEYFQGISRSTLLDIGSFFLGFNHENSAYSHPYNFLKMFFSKKNEKEVEKIIKNFHKYVAEESNSIDTYEFAYVISSLRFFEYIFDNVEDAGEDTLSKEEIELNIFKAYTILNQENTVSGGKIASDSVENVVVEQKPAAISLALQLHNSDLVNYSVKKLFSTQLIRAILFFEFLESEVEGKALVKAFYECYKVEGYSEYLKRLLPLPHAVIMKDKESFTDIVLDGNLDSKEDIEFLENFMVKDTDIADIDFRAIRSSPLYKIGDRKYRIISPMFVLEMIYNGLYWRFKPINDRLPKGEKVKNLYDLKTYNFSEKYVLHRILKEYYGKRYLQKNGEELDAIYDGAPDYYVRNGKRIFLFESKDIMLSAEVKQSSDYAVIKKELIKKLYQKEDGTPKAIIQIVRNVKKILKGNLSFDNALKPHKVIVHPVLVLHYRMFNVPGLNKILNFWFQDELKKLLGEGLDTSRIRPLVIIDIDTLIFNKDAFAEKKISLEESLLEYQEEFIEFTLAGRKYYSETEAFQAQKNSYLPFDSYLDEKIEKMNLRNIPKELVEKGFGLHGI